MTSIHTTNSRESIQNDTQTKDSRIPSAMLFPLAFVQARLFWVYSVIWTLYTRLSSEDIIQPTSSKTSQQTSSEPPSAAEDAITASVKASRRSRGQSAPPASSQESTPSSSPIPQEQRIRGKTISTESPSTSLSTRRAFHPDNNELVLLRPLPQDERNGTTCPPQWWQKTRFYLDARKQQQQRSRSPSPAVMPAVAAAAAPSPVSMSDPTLPLTRFSESSVDKPAKKETAATAVITITNQQQEAPAPAAAAAVAATPLDPVSFEKQTHSKRKRLLDLLNHHHHNHHHFSGKHHFWKKKTGPAPAL